jgi:ABC-2 type transport system ATP-binding protein
LLTGPDVSVSESGPDLLEVTGLAAPQIGDLAAAHGIAIHELTPQRASLEEAFMKLTNDAIEFHGGTTAEMTGITGQRVAA